MLLGYKKDRLQLLTVITAIWLLFGVVSLMSSLLEGEVNIVLPVLYIAQALVFYGVYTYCKVNKYIFIGKEFIQRNTLWKTKAHINDILKVRKNGKVYFIYTSERTIRINTKLLDTQSVVKLESFINGLPMAVSV